MAPLTTLAEVVAFSLFLLSAWVTIHLYVNKNGHIAAAKSITKIHNWFYAAASLVMLIQIPLDHYHTTTTDKDNNTKDKLDSESSYTARYIFHLSKFYESLDIPLVSASGGQIGVALVFHHFTTPYLTYIRYLRHSRGWRPFAALNNLHHVLVYTFFGCNRRRANLLLRSILPWSGVVQLIVSIQVDVRLGLEKYYDVRGREPYWPNLAAVLLVGGYYVLFFQGFGFQIGQRIGLLGVLLGVLLCVEVLRARLD